MVFGGVLEELRAISERGARAARAAECALRLAQVETDDPIGVLLAVDLLPSLDVGRRCATGRARRVLSAVGLSTLSSLLKVSVPTLWELKGCGDRSVTDILTAVLLTATDASAHDLKCMDPVQATFVMELSESPAPEDRHRLLIRRAKQLAASESQDPLGRLLGVERPDHRDVRPRCGSIRSVGVLNANGLATVSHLAPLSVQDLWDLQGSGLDVVQDILQALIVTVTEGIGTTDDEVVVEADVDPDTTLADLLELWVSQLDDRQLATFRHRVVSRDQTLDDLGKEFGVSRERIRQVEQRVVEDFEAWRESTAVQWRLKALETEVRAAVPTLIGLAALTQRFPQLREELRFIGPRLGDVVGVLFPSLYVEEEWVATRPLPDLRDETVRAAAEANLDTFRDQISLHGEEWARWLDSCGLRSVGSLVVRKTASQPELAVAVLRQAGHPMRTEEIAELLGLDAIRSLRNRLLDDERIARVGPNSFGLPEWQLETYEGIRDEIVQRIERAGGRAWLPAVVDELVEQFGVSPRSVRAYATRKEFVRTDGWISLAGQGSAAPGRPRTAMATPAETRRCFLYKGLWWFRVDVRKDLLRGSGLTAPVGVMTLFQVAEGAERVLSALGQDIRFSWTAAQPQIGSLRPIASRLDAKEGDVLWLTPTGGGAVRVRLVRGWKKGEDDEVAIRTGVPRGLTGEDLRVAVAGALMLPEETSWETLVTTLRSRGDLELAEVVEAYTVSSAARPGAVPDLGDFFAALDGR
ncbi:hypothetical protein Sme01_19040 [Sphaerisporangium melleum]|uniref:RNA polymerase sigma-70 region 4 domain-containing protein n=1 Tax=Sphaerisporangium melleum TaxID=321316 RepID=A0A917RE25_9ACTN|nr:sigma factor-like helix-turn-helix DNA-binding protein [Sphaerisporangium melleum]GGL03190.1 hypothetical protein GCM10007964_51610 [Sphaerisporangium melleum]GII69428.1 hypothetical protein Sme01_19040 [Sphaerisporangium melleum]